MSNEASIKALRKAVKKPAIEEGTVVRFQVTFPGALHDYRYSAVYIDGMWYTSAQMRNSELPDGATIHPRLNQHGMEAVLRSSAVHSVEVATAWESL